MLNQNKMSGHPRTRPHSRRRPATGAAIVSEAPINAADAKKKAKRAGPQSIPETISVAGIGAALDQLGLVSISDSTGRILQVNDEFVRVSKYAREDLIGQTHALLNSGHHQKEFWAKAYAALADNQAWRSPVKNRAKDGSFYWVDVVIVPLKGTTKRKKKYLSVQIDITKAVNLHMELQNRTALLQTVVESFPGGLTAYDRDGSLIICNETQKKLLDHPAELFSSGDITLEKLLRFNAARGEYGPGDVEDQVQRRLKRAAEPRPQISERRRPNGTHVEIRTTPLPDGGFVCAHLDITERKRDQETIARLAHHDSLTGLPNRALFQDRIKSGLASIDRGDTMALHCLDLDRFKSVNDTLGHPVGDRILQIVAERLRGVLRDGDTVARLGGDEFAVIQRSPKSPTEAENIAQRIIGVLSAPFVIGENTISIGTTIGIAMAPADGSDAEQLMMNADMALYRTKMTGRGNYGFFEPAMHQRLQSRLQIIMGLREAIANNQFELHYQPIVNIKTRKIAGCEALIRWSHPERGLIPASEFIPIAEECGLIGEIGDWVLKTACEEASQWPDDVWVAVNISPAQFRSQNLIDKVTSASRSLPLSRLILEITETLLMKDRESATSTLENLRKMGVRFAIDDFGTGFSSLSYLQSFPFDKIKIDRSFVSTIANTKRSATLRRSIIQLGYNLGMTSVAEGIETEQQLGLLRAEGCIEGQGWLFSKAVPATKMRSLFSTVL